MNESSRVFIIHHSQNPKLSHRNQTSPFLRVLESKQILRDPQITFQNLYLQANLDKVESCFRVGDRRPIIELDYPLQLQKILSKIILTIDRNSSAHSLHNM